MDILIFIGALFFAHFLMDYPLQGDFLARAKNRFDPIPHVPWWQALSAHSFLHAGAVYFVLGIWWIAALEFATHWVIDYKKCEGELTFNQDQALHLGLKVVWVVLALLAV
jgi:hypothetical protein